MAEPEQHGIGAMYRRFADHEAQGRSPLYAVFARGVAADAEILKLLAAMPPPKRQPNLLLAAVRHIAGVAQDWTAFRCATLARWSEIHAVMLSRSTQTNEPGRCATLLPVFALLPQPLALIEVGASAGLCLLPDRYSYDYGGYSVRPNDARLDAPEFPCRASPSTPLPHAVPRIVWRAGLDLNPLDVTDSDQMKWLEALIWPEQTGRVGRFRAAVRIAQADPPRVRRGDLRDGITALAAEAPREATLVVFHTAVLGYVSPQSERAAFAASVSSLCDYWVSNEAPRVLPDIAARAPADPPQGRFILAVNGAPVAWTDPHGAALEWISALPKRSPRSPSPDRR